MEPRESIPSLNLGSIASDRRASGGEAGKNESTRSGGSRNEVETQTCGAAAGGGCERGEGSEIEDSKSSLELLDEAKDGESVSSSSSSFAPVLRDPTEDQRLKRHHPDRADNIGSNALETNESSPIPDSIRSSAGEMIPPPDTDHHLPISRDRSRRKTDEFERDLECSLDSAVEDAIAAENKRLKQVLSRERRHHLKEKNRIRQVLIAIDEALSTLPSRLGKIRVQNQRNLMKMNTLPVEFHDRGDFEMISGNCPGYLGNAEESQKTSIRLSRDDYSDMSSPRNASVFEKIESLNNLIEAMKKGRAAPIEAVLDNELCAISLLKNEIKYTKREIERRSRTDSESAVVTNWQWGNVQIPYLKNWNPRRVVNSEEIEKLEKYICLQKEAISVLAMQVERTRELCVKEMEHKEQVRKEKRALLSEIMRLRNREGSQGSRTRSGDTSVPRPFRLIKELRGQLQEKDKVLSNLKAKISRLEAASANKGTLLDNEKKKTEELEGRLKILASENKSFSVQINSLQYINKELKEQMNVLKSQIEILIEKNAEFSACSPYDLQRNFAEVMEMLKREDERARAVQEEADKKLREHQHQHQRETDGLRASFERCEKMNSEYLRTLKGVILYVHNYQTEKSMRGKRRNSYGKVKEILGITDLELESLFGENPRKTGEKEVQDLYDRCYSFVSGSDECEFSFKLSAWLFDLIKQKMTSQNFNESLSD